MKFIEDESIQSWIYRTLFLNGAADYSSVIGINSMWRETPHFTSECDIDIKYISDTDLINFLRKSNIAQKRSGIFDNPIDYVNEAKFVLQGRTEPNSKGTISIGYCPYCISDSISKFGFGYFKAIWLTEDNCKIHNIKLDFMPITSKVNGLKLIREIISGKRPSKKLKSSENKSLAKPTPCITVDYHVMPCILMEFYRVASSEWSNIFPKPRYIDFYFMDGRRKYTTDSFLHIKFVTYSEKYPLEFNKFMLERSEVINYKFGINQEHSLSEKLLKSKGSNCSKCYRLSLGSNCPVQPLIAIEYLDFKSFIDSNNQVNRCDHHLKYRY